MDEDTLRRRVQVRFGAIAVGLVIVAIAGYAGFVAFVETNPGVSAGVMILAAATGFAAFFSPCSFPLLLTFLTRRTGESAGAAVASAFRVGAGAAALLGLFAIGIAAGGVALGRFVEFNSTTGRVFRLSVGILLIFFGLRQAHLLGIRMRWIDRIAATAGRTLGPPASSNPAGADFAYGFGYLLVGFG